MIKKITGCHDRSVQWDVGEERTTDQRSSHDICTVPFLLLYGGCGHLSHAGLCL